MGTFERIRKISPYFFGTMAVLLVAYFVFTSGAEDIARQAMDDPKTAAIAVVNGEKILYADFMQKVQSMVEQQRNQQQGKEVEIDEAAVRSQVFDQMIEETLVRQAAEKVGITVTDEELRDLLLENPPDYLKRGFSDSAGNFNRALYLDVVTNPDKITQYLPQDMPADEKQKRISSFRNDLILIADYLRLQKLSERLVNVVNTSETFISPTYIKEKYINETGSASIKYITIDGSGIKDDQIKVTDADIKAYYDKNKQYYKQKPVRKIKYISIPIAPSKEDTLKAEKRIDKISESLASVQTVEQKDSIFEINFEQFNGFSYQFTMSKDIKPEVLTHIGSLQKGDVVGPVTLTDGIYFFRLDERRTGTKEVVKASHILVNFGTSKDSAKKAAESILQRANSGEDFGMLALQLSEDKLSGAQGCDLGYFEREAMVKPFSDAAFAASPGQIVGPVESEFGYHIIKVFDKLSDEVKYSEIKIEPKISQITRNQIKRNAFAFKDQIDKGANFTDLAKKLKYNALETAFFEKNKPVLSSQYITDVAFQSEIGDIPEPIELEKQGYIVFQILDKREEGIKPLEDMKNELKARVMNIKRLDMLKSKAEAVYSKVSGLQDLSQIEAMDPNIKVKVVEDYKNTGMVPGLGLDVAFSENAYTLPINKISKPIRGSRTYFIMQVTSRNIPDNNTLQGVLPAYTQSMLQQLKQSNYYGWFNKLRENADIKDNRYKYFRDY